MTSKQEKLIENYVRQKVKKMLKESSDAQVGDSVNITDRNSMVKGKTGVISGELKNSWLVTVLVNGRENTVLVAKNGAVKIPTV